MLIKPLQLKNAHCFRVALEHFLCYYLFLLLVSGEKFVFKSVSTTARSSLGAGAGGILEMIRQIVCCALHSGVHCTVVCTAQWCALQFGVHCTPPSF